jgi:hypothetical protein
VRVSLPDDPLAVQQTAVPFTDVATRRLGVVVRLRASPKGQLAHTASLITEECPHHPVSDAGMILQPACQVVNQLDSGTQVDTQTPVFKIGSR